MKNYFRFSLLFTLFIISCVSIVEASDLKTTIYSDTTIEKKEIKLKQKPERKSYVYTPEKVQNVLDEITKKDKLPGEWGVILKITFFIKRDINFVIYLDWGNISSGGTIRNEIKEDIKKQIEKELIDFNREGKIYCFFFKDKYQLYNTKSRTNLSKDLSERKFNELLDDIQKWLKENDLDDLWYEED